MNIIHLSFARVLATALALLPLALSAHAGNTSVNPPTSGPTVPGNRAVLRGGIAYAPANAPTEVKRAIWAANNLRRLPYVFGGGHRSFSEKGYDCSGTVSYLLGHAGKLSSPIASREFTTYGGRGQGRWITIYARSGHVFAVVAGLRLDAPGQGRDNGPRWRPNDRPGTGFIARHPEGL